MLGAKVIPPIIGIIFMLASMCPSDSHSVCGGVPRTRTEQVFMIFFNFVYGIVWLGINAFSYCFVTLYTQSFICMASFKVKHFEYFSVSVFDGVNSPL